MTTTIQIPATTIEERLSTASPGRALCVSCGVCVRKGIQTPFMIPFRPSGWTKKLLIVGEAAGEHEDETSGTHFTGPAGKLLRKLWKAAGYDDVDVALVNALRGRPRGNATPSMQQLRACRGFLLRSIAVLQPRLVVAVGASAAKALLDRGSVSVTQLRGRQFTLQFPDLAAPLRVTYHPSAVLRGATHFKRRIVDDLRRARQYQPLTLDILTEGFPLDKVISVDTEYDPSHNALTIGVASRTQARTWDVGDGIQGA